MVSTGWPDERPIEPVDILSVPQPLTPRPSASSIAVAESHLVDWSGRFACMEVTPFSLAAVYSRLPGSRNILLTLING
jgi:hypothetical protein